MLMSETKVDIKVLRDDTKSMRDEVRTRDCIHWRPLNKIRKSCWNI